MLNVIKPFTWNHDRLNSSLYSGRRWRFVIRFWLCVTTVIEMIIKKKY